MRPRSAWKRQFSELRREDVLGSSGSARYATISANSSTRDRSSPKAGTRGPIVLRYRCQWPFVKDVSDGGRCTLLRGVGPKVAGTGTRRRADPRLVPPA